MTTPTQPDAENGREEKRADSSAPASESGTPAARQPSDTVETAQPETHAAGAPAEEDSQESNGRETGGADTGGAETGAKPDKPDPQVDEPAPEVLYCANHPDRETLLRCNRCGKPICLKCATLTDVGYRCRECIRGVQDSYFNATAVDNVIALVVSGAVAAVVTPIAGLVLGITGFFGIIVAFLAGGAAGGTLAQIVRMAVGQRRGRYLRFFALGGLIAGLFVGALIGAIFLGRLPLLPLLLFAILAAVSAYQILR